MDATRIEEGKKYRVRLSGSEHTVTILRRSGTTHPLWRCKTDNGLEVVAAFADFIEPVDDAKPRAQTAPLTRGGHYRVRLGAQEIIVEIQYPSHHAAYCWIARQFVDGETISIHERDVIERVDGD